MTVKRQFQRPQWLSFEFFRAIVCDFTRPSFHRCIYGTYIDRCPYGPCATCLHKRRTCYTSRFTETLLLLEDINPPDEDDQNNVVQIPALQYKLEYCRHRQWRAVFVVCAYFAIIWSQLSPAEHCMSWSHLTTCLTIITNNTAEKCFYPTGRWRVSKTKRAPYNIFDSFLAKYHTMERCEWISFRPVH
jgi:hypothetical protein